MYRYFYNQDAPQREKNRSLLQTKQHILCVKCKSVAIDGHQSGVGKLTGCMYMTMRMDAFNLHVLYYSHVLCYAARLIAL